MAGPTERVLALLSLLQTHRSWSGSELAERLGVSTRTLRRDVDRLRALGYPVDASPGLEGGYRLAAGAHLPPLLLDDDEAVAVAVGLRTSAAGVLPGTGDMALRTLAKLEQMLPDRLRRRVRAVYANTAVLRWGAPDVEVDTDALATLALACRDQEEVRFDYRRRDGDESARLVQPHHLVLAGRRWYLIAWDVRRDDWRTFRVDRLARLRLAGASFTERALPGGDPAAFVAQSIRAAPQSHQVEVHVGASPEEVRERFAWLAEEVSSAGSSSVVVLKGDSVDWLVALLCTIAARLPIVEVRGDQDVLDLLGPTGHRLAAASLRATTP